MKKSALYSLVHSLSGSEKRYFRIMCRQQGDNNNYLQLFDEIARQEKYDEQAIRIKFKGRKFTGQLHVTKHYLRNLLLKSLRNYHSKTSKNAEMVDLLRNIEILYNKELHSLCAMEIEKAEKLGIRYELNTYLMEVYQWKRRVIQVLAPFDVPAIQETVEGEAKALQRIVDTHQHKKKNVDLYHSMLSSVRIGRPSNLAITDEKVKAETLEGTVYLYHSRYYQYINNEEFGKAESALYELISYLERRPHRIEEDPGLYVSTINNFLGYLVFSHQYDKALQLIEQVKSKYARWRPGAKTRVLMKQVFRTYNIELEIRRDEQRKQEASVAVDDIASFILENEQKVPLEYAILFWYQFASIYFMQKNYAASLKWINKLLNIGNRTIRVDIQVYARILNLMIHLELKNLFVLGYYVDSTRRYLKKNKMYDAWKVQLLKFFSKIRRTPDYESKTVFKACYGKLFPENEDPVISKEILDYIDLERWMKQRIK